MRLRIHITQFESLLNFLMHNYPRSMFSRSRASPKSNFLAQFLQSAWIMSHLVAMLILKDDLHFLSTTIQHTFAPRPTVYQLAIELDKKIFDWSVSNFISDYCSVTTCSQPAKACKNTLILPTHLRLSLPRHQERH
jgi:hypothetical protein